MTRCCALLLLILIACDGYKFLVYSPIFGYSHTNFMGAIADTLTEAGHDVTVLMSVMDLEKQDKARVKRTNKIIEVSADPRVIDMMRYRGESMSKMWTMQPSLPGLMQKFQVAENMTKMFTNQCERLFNDVSLIKQLNDQEFDVGIAEVFDICGLGVFELVKIPASIGAFAGVHMDSISEAIGEPIILSYVPGALAAAGDRINFVDRFKNILDVVLGQKLFNQVFEREIQAFRGKFGPHFKGYEQLLAETSYIITNSNPYFDYPRPMLHKTVPVGGIAVSIDPRKNTLSAEWDAILNERNTTVLVSFGSVAKAIYMPDEYRNTLLKVFESMPDTTFIMKYEDEGSKIAQHLPNVHLSTWFPQNALLADPRLTVFVTHGGLGSTTELAHQGKPAILVRHIAITHNAWVKVL
ncbi:hypothetical protein Aduo_011325 [Ancylostoma duodenale]